MFVKAMPISLMHTLRSTPSLEALPMEISAGAERSGRYFRGLECLRSLASEGTEKQLLSLPYNETTSSSKKQRHPRHRPWWLFVLAWVVLGSFLPSASAEYVEEKSLLLWLAVLRIATAS